jgi:hypothetical protein
MATTDAPLMLFEVSIQEKLEGMLTRMAVNARHLGVIQGHYAKYMLRHMRRTLKAGTSFTGGAMGTARYRPRSPKSGLWDLKVSGKLIRSTRIVNRAETGADGKRQVLAVAVGFDRKMRRGFRTRVTKRSEHRVLGSFRARTQDELFYLLSRWADHRGEVIDPLSTLDPKLPHVLAPLLQQAIDDFLRWRADQLVELGNPSAAESVFGLTFRSEAPSSTAGIARAVFGL